MSGPPALQMSRLELLSALYFTIWLINYLVKYTTEAMLSSPFLFSHNIWYRVDRMKHGKRRYQTDNRDLESMWRELFGNGPAVGDRSADGKALGGSREATLGVCTLAGSEAAVDGTEAVQGVVERRIGKPGEGMARSHGLLPGEAGGIGPRPRIEGLPIDNTPVSEASRHGSSQYQTEKAFIPEWAGDETP